MFLFDNASHRWICSDNTDCNDDRLLNGFGIKPSADEVCDGIDNNCNEITDNDAIDQIDFYPDADNDQHLAMTPMITFVRAQGYLELSLHFDCDDTNPLVYVDAQRFAMVLTMTVMNCLMMKMKFSRNT